MSSQIMTVLGPVPPESIGFTDAHNHVWIEPPPGAAPDAPQLADSIRIAQELESYRAAGGGALVDCQPGGCGRDGDMLAQLSAESGVHIIASAGFHRKRYYGPEPALWQLSADEAADYFLAEIRQGMSETRHRKRPIHPGLIKIAAEATLAETPRPLLEAATAAARVSGYTMEVHTERGTAVEDLLDFFLAHDLPSTQLVFCHVDKRPDVGLHQELAEAGVMLEYDTFFRPKYDPEQNLWPLIRRMVDAGWGEMLALATDMADSAMWRSFGGEPGLAAFLTTIKPRLQEMEISEELIKQLLGGNIIRRLQLPVASGSKSNERKTV